MLGTLGPGSHLGAPRLARHQQCPNTRFSRRIVCAQGSDRGEETLSTLDSLLGQQPENKAAAQLEPLVEWWKIRPKQNAPPRQSGMTSGSQGRFIMNEDLLRLSELRVGRKTVVGAAGGGAPGPTPGQLDAAASQPGLLRHLRQHP
ncbi:hypothetical protein V8C86DRAFT_644906 [Haematococcus lacustris]